jgi:hypothetical protein
MILSSKDKKYNEHMFTWGDKFFIPIRNHVNPVSQNFIYYTLPDPR